MVRIASLPSSTEFTATRNSHNLVISKIALATVTYSLFSVFGFLNFSGGPVGPPSRLAATSNVDVVQTAYPDNRSRVVIEEREWSQGQSHKGEERKEGSGTGEGTRDRQLSREASIWIFV